MKIVVFKRASVWGGGETYTKSLCEGLEKEGQQTCLFSNSRELLGRIDVSKKRELSFLPDATTRTNLVIFLIFWPLDFFRYFWHLAGTKTQGYKILILQDLNEKLLATFPAKILGFRIFWVEHTTWEPYLFRHPLFFTLKTAGRLTDKIIVPSEFLARQIRKIPTLASRVEIIPHGVWPVTLGSERREPGLVCVSRFTADKNVKGLIEAMPYFEGKTKLIIVGDGPERDELRFLVENLGLENRVEFLGAKPKPFEYVSPSDILVVPSNEENFPLVILEAMSAGLTIVATRVGGIPEQIEDGKNGYLADPNDPKDLADKINKILKNRKIQTKMSSQNIIKYKRGFTLETMITKTEKLLVRKQ